MHVFVLGAAAVRRVYEAAAQGGRVHHARAALRGGDRHRYIAEVNLIDARAALRGGAQGLRAAARA